MAQEAERQIPPPTGPKRKTQTGLRVQRKITLWPTPAFYLKDPEGFPQVLTVSLTPLVLHTLTA